MKFAGYIVSSLSVALTACAGVKPEASYPTRPETADGKIVYSDEQRSTVFVKVKFGQSDLWW